VCLPILIALAHGWRSHNQEPHPTTHLDHHVSDH
jgi:hypothetical protein